MVDHTDLRDHGENWLLQAHIMRYRFAESFVPKGIGRILDVGCGPGYGSYHLATLNPECEVVGCDIDEALVEAARRDYRLNNLRFEVAGAQGLPFPDGSCDLVVCFEVVEHVADGQAMLEELGRVLRPDGRLVCSTPNARYSIRPFDPRKPKSPFRSRGHLKLYTPDEFAALASRVFAEVTMYRQFQNPAARFSELQYRYKLYARSLFIRPLVRLVPRRWRGSGRASTGATSGGEASTPRNPFVIQRQHDYPNNAVRQERAVARSIPRIAVAVCRHPRGSA